MYLHSFITNFLTEQEDISDKNKEKIEAAKYKYFNSGYLPRKKKKKAKQDALKDYNFWKSLDNWHSNLFQF
jgi:hypothetical protein